MRLALVFCALLTAACGPSVQQLNWISAGHVGCSPSDIEISEQQTQQGLAVWAATCHGERYYCSATDGAHDCTRAKPDKGQSRDHDADAARRKALSKSHRF